MPIARKSLVKWTLIVFLCGAHSAFWGMETKASPLAMVAGLLTLSLLYAWVDSQPSYQSNRQKKPVLAKALDWGVRIRIALAVYIPLMLALGEGLKIRFLMFPVMGEMSIGMLAIEAARTLTGVSLTARGEVDAAAHFVASYLATILTGLMHTAILAVLCGIIYGVLKLKHCVWR